MATTRAQTEAGLAGLDVFQSLAALLDSNNADDEANTLSVVLAMVGQGSPAIVGGVLLLLNEMAVRIGIAVGPLMLFALLFESTKDLFFAWVRLMLASLLYMAILALVVAKAAVLMAVFVGIMAAAKLADMTGLIFTDLQTSLTQAGFGLMLSALIYSVPHMAARFFGGGMMASAVNIFSGMRTPGTGGGGMMTTPPVGGNGMLTGGTQTGANGVANTATPPIAPPVFLATPYTGGGARSSSTTGSPGTPEKMPAVNGSLGTPSANGQSSNTAKTGDAS